MLDAWQTNSTEKSKRERPDLGGKNRSPGFLMVMNLDCDVASARRQFEFQKKSAFSCLRKIGISDRNQRCRPLPVRLEDRSASQCSANNSTNSVSGQHWRCKSQPVILVCLLKEMPSSGASK